MAALDDLQRALFPSARRVGGPVAASVAADSAADVATGAVAGRPSPARGPARGSVPDIGWVRLLRARVPALEALEPGDLVIVPGPALAVVAPDPARTEDLAGALAVAGVPAVLLVAGDGGGEALTALGRALAGRGVMTFDLGPTDPMALERSIIGFLVNRRAELDRRAGELETQLTHVALLGRGLDALAAAIATFLGRAVAIESRRGDALAVHAPTDVPGAAAAVTRYLAGPTVGGAWVVDIPAPAGEPAGGGRLVLLGDAAADELARVAAERAATVLALELARDAAVRTARDETRRGDPLPDDGPPWVVLLARQRPVVGPDDRAAREALRSELALLLPDRRLRLRGTAESLEIRLVAAAPPDDPRGTVTAERVAAVLERTVAVSAPFADPAARPGAEASARATLDAAERLGEPPRIARASRLPAFLLLANVRNLPDGVRQARELLAPILIGSAERQRARLDTLAAVVGAPGLGEAAARLGVHRNTIAYRVARLEELGDWDLSDVDLRFALGLAVRIVQDAQHADGRTILNRNPLD